MEKYTTTIVPFGSGAGDNFNKIIAFSELRKATFIDSLGWDLHDIQGQEFDQYDCSWAVYVIVEESETGKVVGGARLLRTDQESYISQLDEEPSSYMIRDAFLGRLEGLPSSVTFQPPPQDPLVWELTRLVATPDVVKEIFFAVNDYLATQAATTCLALSSPSLFKLAKRMGFSPEPLGAIQSNESGRFLTFSCPVNSYLNPNRLAHAMGGAM